MEITRLAYAILYIM